MNPGIAVRGCLALAAAAPLCAARDPPAHPPRIEAHTALSAWPANLAQGNSGPLNRYGFDVREFGPQDSSRRVLCTYSNRFHYRCAYQFSDHTDGRRRVIVEIPDLGKGMAVVVRFENRHGRDEATVELTNSPQVIHEIETVLLEHGGVQRTGGDGAPAVATPLQREMVSTVPGIAMASLGAEPACDRVHAQWVSASATDPVFVSDFGPLNGAVMPLHAMRRGSPIGGPEVPQWLLTYPRSATRVQFIAHYEVLYRIGVCADRVERSP